MRDRTSRGPSILALLLAACGCAQHVVGDAGGTSRVTGPQPGMVGVTSPEGVTYWIDGTEVSQAAYAMFLASNPAPDPSSETCSWKVTFEPGMQSGDFDDPTACHPDNTHYDPAAHPDDPVVCVDWCDAQAYCLWAGKRLCGHVGGGPATEDDFADASASQWYGACSNGGTTAFPYGPEYIQGRCNDGANVAPVGETPGCHGMTAPYSGIFDMSGNVAEWEDSCGPNPYSSGNGVRGDRCLVRGGSSGVPLTGLPLTLTCGGMLDGQKGGTTGYARDFEQPRTGFRCCVD